MVVEKEHLISRVTRSKAEARRAYDKMSRWYDFMAGSSERPYARIGLGLLNAQAGETILEIGSGTGYALAEMAKGVGKSGQVVGLDISPGMASQARQKLERAGVYSRARLVCGDAAHLPLRDEALDAVFMAFTLELFDTPEIQKVLEECIRCLKPGGRLCAVSLSRASGDNAMLRLYEWAHRRMPSYVDCRPIYLQHALEEAGLKSGATVQKKMWGLPLEICLASKG